MLQNKLMFSGDYLVHITLIFTLAKCLPPNEKEYIGTYGSFIGMNMTSKHNINLVLHKPWLKHYPHGFSFHVVIFVAIIPRRMHKNDQPWSLGPINLC